MPSSPQGLTPIAAFYFFYYGFLGVFSPYWGPYLRALDVPMAMIGIVTSLPLINRMYAPAIWGWCVDHTGRHGFWMKLAGVGCLAGFTILLFTHSFNWMFAAVLVSTFFWSAAQPQVDATAMSLLKGNSGGFSRLRVWGSLGFVAVTMIVGYLVDLLGVQILPYAGVLVLIGMAAITWRIPKPETVKVGGGRASGVIAILRRKEVWSLLLGSLLLGVAQGMLLSFYSIHLGEHGIVKSTMAWLWSLAVLAEATLYWFMTHISSRFSMRALYLFSAFAGGVRYLMIAWGADWISVLVIAQLFYALSFGIQNTMAVAYIHRFFGEAHRTTGQALYIVFTYGIGGSVGSVLTGILWDYFGGGWSFSVAALASFIALLISWRTLPLEAGRQGRG